MPHSPSREIHYCDVLGAARPRHQRLGSQRLECTELFILVHAVLVGVPEPDCTVDHRGAISCRVQIPPEAREVAALQTRSMRHCNLLRFNPLTPLEMFDYHLGCLFHPQTT